MKILHTVGSLDRSTGGPARSVPGLASSLADTGQQVGIWAPNCSKTGREGKMNSEFAYRDSLMGDTVRVFTTTFDEAIDRFGKPDLVHDHGIWLPTNRLVQSQARCLKLPRLVSPRGMLEPWALNHRKLKKLVAWWMYQRRDLRSATALHATSDSEAIQFRALGLQAPIIVAPNGVSIPETIFKGHSSIENRTGVHFGSGKANKTALFLSRLHPKKGLPLLVEAWAKLRPKGWQMRIVGPEANGHRAKIKALLEKHGITDQWTFLNSLEGDAKWLAMAEADLFVLPSHSENFGIVVAEALAAGTPVLTTTGTPWQGLLEHDCGWWVEPTLAGVEAGLSQALGAKNEELAAMGLRGRRLVEEKYQWPGIAERMLEFYGWILNGGAQPDFVF